MSNTGQVILWVFNLSKLIRFLMQICIYGIKDQRNIHRKHKIMMLIIAEMQHFLLLYLKNCIYINIIGT